jgi:hypothetical protein
MLSSFLDLHSQQVKPDQWQSTTYIKEEIEKGRWLATPRSPGPFEIQGGRVYFVEPSDGSLPEEWQHYLTGPLCADLALVRTGSDNALQHVTCVWFHQEWGRDIEKELLYQRCCTALDEHRRDLMRQFDKQMPIDGLLMLNRPPREDDTLNDVVIDEIEMANGHSKLVALQLPPDIHEHVKDVHTGLGLITERLFRAAGPS